MGIIGNERPRVNPGGPIGDHLIPFLTDEQVRDVAHDVRRLERRAGALWRLGREGKASWRFRAASVLRWHIRRSGWDLDRPATRLRRLGRKAVRS